MQPMTLTFSDLNPEDRAGSIEQQVRDMMRDSALVSGHRLPSTRALATQLGVARGTVVAALDTLIAEGLLESRKGAGTFVTPEVGYHHSALTPQKLDFVPHFRATPDVDATSTGRINFQPCRPSLEAFPLAIWRRAMADAASQLPSSDYGDPQGVYDLRRTIASYLCRARGMDVEASNIVITSGSTQAMYLIAQMVLAAGDVVAFEDPGYPLARQIFETAGAIVMPIPIDDDGIVVEELVASKVIPKLIYLTPSHQFPLGSRLSLRRRRLLLDFASRTGALVLEDDYDGEFRYDVAPLPPMAIMQGGHRVLYLGTFSKTMFPSLRIGFAVCPKEIASTLAQNRVGLDYQGNAQTQVALAKFIETGVFEKHIHRMRRIYAKKRSALNMAVQTQLDGCNLVGLDSGLNSCIRFDVDMPATQIAMDALQHGMHVNPISRYYYQPAKCHDNALVIGYAAANFDEIDAGIRCLHSLMKGR